MSSTVKTHRGSARVILGICVATGFTTLLDQVIFSFAVPRLRDGLHASASQLQLILSIYSVAFGVALVPAGRLGDIIGRRSLFLLGMAMFSGFSLLGGLAANAQTVIVARLLQGLGAGIINTQVLGLIQDLFEGQERARTLGHYASAGGLSCVVGPLLAGLLLALAPADLGWRLLFLVNVPFGLCVFVLGLRYLPANQSSMGRISFDAQGLTLLSMVTLALMLATLVGGVSVMAPWVWLVVAAVSLLAFIAWEAAFQRRGGLPILSRDLVRSPGYILGAVIAMFQFACALTLGMVTTFFFLDGLKVSPLWLGILSIPGALGMIASSAQSWRFVKRFGRGGIAVAIAVNGLIVVLQGIALSRLSLAWIVWAYPVICLLQGLVGGLIQAPNQALTLADAGQHAGRGVAAGFLQLSQRLACAVGMSWGAGIFFTRLWPGAGLDAYRTAFVAVTLLAVAFACCAFLAALADMLRRRGAAAQRAAPIDQ